MSRARRSTAARLVVAGTALLVLGVILVVVFAAAQTGCQDVTMNQASAVGPRCTTQTVGAAVGWVLVLVGGLSFAAAALSSTPRFSSRPPAPPTDDSPSG